MIALLQRVRQAKVEVDGVTIGSIGAGLMVLLCAEHGDTDAMADLGVMLYEAGDAEAERWLRQAAERRHASAMNNLAGLLAETDRLDEAETWYEQAAEKGLAVAAINIARHHEAAGRSREGRHW